MGEDTHAGPFTGVRSLSRSHCQHAVAIAKWQGATIKAMLIDFLLLYMRQSKPNQAKPCPALPCLRHALQPTIGSLAKLLLARAQARGKAVAK